MSNRLLIIDDDAGCRTQLGAFFEDSGWEIWTAASGEAGIARLDQALPDALIVDLDMPGMRGTEVIAWVMARLRICRRLSSPAPRTCATWSKPRTRVPGISS